MDWYNKLPEWLRWVLFLPASSLFSVVAGWFLLLTVANYLGGWGIRLQVMYPAVLQALFLVGICATVPRAKKLVVTILIVLRSVFLLLFITITAIVMLGIFPDIVEEMDWQNWWAPFIGEIIVFGVSIGFYRMISEEGFDEEAVT